MPVSIGQISRVDVTLEVGTLTRNGHRGVGGRSCCRPTRPTCRTELKSAEITAMPLNRFRNYQALINLVPGTTPMAFGNAETDTPARSLATNVNGQANTNNSTRTDGATNMNIWLPNHNMYISPAETIDTVNVSTSSFDAEQGMAGGAAVTVITKSGTNQFRGSAFEFYNSDKLNATPYYFGAGGEARQAAGQAEHLRRHARRAIKQEQACSSSGRSKATSGPEPVHVLQRAGRGAAQRRLQQRATNNDGTQQTIYNPFTGGANGVGPRSRSPTTRSPPA